MTFEAEPTNVNGVFSWIKQRRQWHRLTDTSKRGACNATKTIQTKQSNDVC